MFALRFPIEYAGVSIFKLIVIAVMGGEGPCGRLFHARPTFESEEMRTFGIGSNGSDVSENGTPLHCAQAPPSFLVGSAELHSVVVLFFQHSFIVSLGMSEGGTPFFHYALTAWTLFYMFRGKRLRGYLIIAPI